MGLVDTLELLTTAVLGVFVAVNEMLGQVGLHPIGETAQITTTGYQMENSMARPHNEG